MIKSSATVKEIQIISAKREFNLANRQLGQVNPPYIRTTPLEWMQTASKLSGKCSNLALAIWHKAGVTKSKSVRITWTCLTDFGITRQAYYRCIKKMVEAGLLTIEEEVGKKPLITILNAQTFF